jgi:SWI/SNF-related matrix-associated actin-dependent regulator 1 of chromatin subfamily A
MLLTHNGFRFIFRCSFEDRKVPRGAGFSWDSSGNYWYTMDPRGALRLRAYADERAKKILGKVLLLKVPMPAAPFSPVSADGHVLYPHQVQAIRYALERNRSYLGLDPGLGKTACAAVVTATLGLPAVYVLPPFLLGNVKNEFTRWAPKLKVGAWTDSLAVDVLLVPDSALSVKDSKVLKRVGMFLKNRTALLIVDEAHRFKSPTSKRTKALFGGATEDGLVDLFERQIYLSGTPMPNRPIELYALLSKAAPETIDFKSRFDFGREYCGAKRGPFGWDFSGATNMPRLAERVIHPAGPFMLRLKKDLLDLPPKIEEIFILSDELSPRLASLDRDLLDTYGDVDDFIKSLPVDTHLMTYRKELGVSKARLCLDYLKSVLEESDESIIVFAYHKDAIKTLETGLADFTPAVVTGDVPAAKRQGLVDHFQKGGTRLLIGNYVAMGVGFNITKATRVFFVEFDWVPGVNEQAADRAHRIGQTGTVFVQYAVFQNSLDRRVIEALLNKRQNIAHV